MASGGGVGKVMGGCLILIVLLSTTNEVRCHPAAAKRSSFAANEAVFDVTKFKAKGDGKTDNGMAFIRTWVAACQAGGAARLLIPRGNFVAGEVVFQGPCKGPMTIDIVGTVLAYSDLSAYPQQSWMQIERVENLVVTGRGSGTIDGRGSAVWKYSSGSNQGERLPVSLMFMDVKNTKISDLKFLNSMGVHLKVTDSRDVDISKLTITAPGDSPNTDGIHISTSANIKVLNTVIGTGDDCVSIGDGTENILIAGIICGPGHGLSIGSLGKRPDELSLKGITIRDSTLVGSTNGARIKTYHQSPKMEATNIVFENLIMKGVKNPIIIDQHYDSKHKRQQSSVRLSDIHFRNIRGTSISPVAISLNCSSSYPCQKVELSNINLTPFSSSMEPMSSACSSANIYTGGKVVPPAPTRCK